MTTKYLAAADSSFCQNATTYTRIHECKPVFLDNQLMGRTVISMLTSTRKIFIFSLDSLEDFTVLLC